MRILIVIIPLLCGLVKENGAVTQQSILDKASYLLTRTDENYSIVSEINRIKDIRLKHETTCRVCVMVMHQVITLRKSGASKTTMAQYFRQLCAKFTDWSQEVCEGYIEIEKDTALFILDNRQNITAERICSIALMGFNCIDPDADQWVIDLPPLSSDSTDEDNSSIEGSTIKILQITDVHYDPDYKAGSSSVCSNSLCCQSGLPKNISLSAGIWGDYHVCDMPWCTFLNLMAQVKEEKPDLIYFTGDIISHDSWKTTKDKNTQSIKTFYKLLKSNFPNTTVYPILGNHEPHPTDFYSPEKLSDSELSTRWLFDLASEEWSTWLPKETQTTIKKGGFYTVLVKPGFRIIAINSNVCFNGNMWLIYDDVDPNGGLKWLVDVLYEAEKKKEKVHLLSHIPPGHDLCHRQWSNQFRKIFTRFSKTIAAQFNGHTHWDELRILYNSTKKQDVIGVAYNGGSFTTFVGSNPNYKTYSIETPAYKVQDFATFTFNLTEANQSKDQSPRWFKLYSFQEAYGINPSDFEQMGTFVDILSRNSATLKEYHRHLVRDSEKAETCDDNCLKTILCSITAAETSEAINCLYPK